MEFCFGSIAVSTRYPKIVSKIQPSFVIFCQFVRYLAVLPAQKFSHVFFTSSVPSNGFRVTLLTVISDSGEVC